MNLQQRLALRTALTEQAVRIHFTKKDGTARKMLCQLKVNRDLGICERLRELEEVCPINPSTARAWTVYSLEDDGYRRFHPESVVVATVMSSEETIFNFKEDEYIEAYQEFRRNL